MKKMLTNFLSLALLAGFGNVFSFAGGNNMTDPKEK